MLVRALQESPRGQLQLEGYARLAHVRPIREAGRWVAGLTLQDASGDTEQVIAPCAPAQLASLLSPGIVKLRIQLCEQADDGYARAVQIRRASPEEITNAATLLPRSVCPPGALASLDALIAFNGTIAHPALRRFLNAVLLDPAIGIPLLLASASHGYHHAESGGLLIHSTEMLSEAARLAATAFPNNPAAVATIQVGYLLHDLGKVVTHAPSAVRSAERHEALTSALLAAPMRVLHAQAPNLALALHQILEHGRIPARQRGIASFLGADIVIWCDQLSTARNHGSHWARLLAEPAMNDAEGGIEGWDHG